MRALPITLLVVGLAGCASLPRGDAAETGNVTLTAETLHRLEGRYAYVSSNRTPLFSDYLLGPEGRRGEEETSGAAYVEVRVPDDGHVGVTVYGEDGTPVAFRTLRGAVRDSGYFETRRLGIGPAFPLLWGLGSGAVGIGLTAEQDLYVTRWVSGIGFVLVIPVFGTTGGSSATFRRLDP